MIYLIIGTNAYQAQQEVQKIATNLQVKPEKIDVDSLDLNKLADLARGLSLFQETRVLVLRQLSEKKDLWEKIAEWADEVASETHIILLEPSVDKRTKAYKALRKTATLIEVNPWTDRQRNLAERWLEKYATERGVNLNKAQISNMVSRAFVVNEKARTIEIDQLQLTHAVAALSHAHSITDEAIATVLPPAREFSVFDILELAIRRDMVGLKSALEELTRTDDPYKIAAMIWGQWAQFAMVFLAGQSEPSEGLAGELGIHPFAYSKMQKLAAQMTLKDVKKYNDLATRYDIETKSTGTDAWQAAEAFLYDITLREN